jgi:prepilin peptidase CpaA
MFGGNDIALWAILIIASATDLIWGKVYNVVTLPACAIGILVHFILGGPKVGFAATASLAIAFAIFFPLHVLKIMGAADVKLLMAIGAWSNVRNVILISALSVIFGAIAGAVILVRKEGVHNSAAHVGKSWMSFGRSAKGTHRMPFAPAFLCAFMLLKIAGYYQ